MPAIHRALLTLPASVFGDRAQARLDVGVRALISALPAGIDLVIAGPPSVWAMVETQAEAGGRRVRFIPVAEGEDFTLWCQDSFLSGRAPDGEPRLLLPSVNRRRRDDWLADHVARELGVETARIDLAFEGGNVFVTKRFLFLGGDTPAGGTEALLARGEGERRLVRVGMETALPARSIRLVDGAGGPTVEEVFGHAGRRQPLYHLDLFMTPAGAAPDGRETVLVGDSREACRIAGPDRLPFGDQSLADDLDETADRLSREDGLLVLRNPLPIVPVLDAGLRRWSLRTLARRYEGWRGLDEVLEGLRRNGCDRAPVLRWRAATQNGCLVFGEPGRGGSVLLPGYAQDRTAFLAPVEAANAAIWISLGYETRTLPGFMAFAVENGSLHCMYKALPV